MAVLLPQWELLQPGSPCHWARSVKPVEARIETVVVILPQLLIRLPCSLINLITVLLSIVLMLILLFLIILPPSLSGRQLHSLLGLKLIVFDWTATAAFKEVWGVRLRHKHLPSSTSRISWFWVILHCCAFHHAGKGEDEEGGEQRQGQCLGPRHFKREK